MATRIGATCGRCDLSASVTGSIEPASAPISSSSISIRPTTCRGSPATGAVYSQLGLRHEVDRRRRRDVRRRWLMRDRRLLTIDEDELARGARDVARRIDAFLIEREQSVLQKLIAIGGAAEEESFEVQAKARVGSAEAVRRPSPARTSR
jgi:5-methylthioadenosine/S-adenosylhomocysteine deaminase